MTTLNPRQLSGALRAGACGIHPLEAGTGLLIDCGSWLDRTDFTSRFITAGTSISDGVTLLASLDWETAVTAFHAGELPAELPSSSWVDSARAAVCWRVWLRRSWGVVRSICFSIWWRMQTGARGR